MSALKKFLTGKKKGSSSGQAKSSRSSLRSASSEQQLEEDAGIGYKNIKEKDLPKLHKAAWSGDVNKLKQFAKKGDVNQMDKQHRYE